jgi:hypothetical protein
MKKDFEKLCSLLAEKFPGSILNYGLAHEAIEVDQGANYYSIPENRACGVSDQHDLTFFYIQESATPNDQIRGGNKGPVSRNVSYKLVGMSKKHYAEAFVTSVVNQIPGMTYTDSNMDSKAIASTYWGTPNFNFELYFFTVDFTVLEDINCPTC